MATAQARPLIRHVRRLVAPHLAATATDPWLLERFAAERDEAAFAALVRRHGPAVLAVCRRVLRDPHLAEDAFQATFLVLARQAGSLRRPESLGAWLHGVACRTARKAGTAEARRRAVERRAATPPQARDPDDLVWRDLRPVLDGAVNGLAERYRVPFVLHHLQGLAVAEVARRLGCPQGTVAARLARAREQLRGRLARRGLTLSAGALAAVLSQKAVAAWVPATLPAATARAAAAVAGEGMAAGTVSATAADLAQGGQAMLTAKVKAGAALLLIAAVAAGGAALSGQRTPAGERAAPPRREAAATPARDANPGDSRIEVREAWVVATVNGEPILAEEVEAAAVLSLPNAGRLSAPERLRRLRAAWRETLERVVEREVVLQDGLGRFQARGAEKLFNKLQEAAGKEYDRRRIGLMREHDCKKDEEFRELLRGLGLSPEVVRPQWERDFMAAEYLRARAPNDPRLFLAELKQRAVIEYAGG
jgi:RNA polymerase sigma factor (sigma-70 family)